MSLTRYIILFSRPGRKLRLAEGVRELTDFATKIESYAIICEFLDEDGIPYLSGRKEVLSGPIDEFIKCLSNRGDSFVIEMQRGHWIYGIHFHVDGCRLPKVCILWDQKMFLHMPLSEQVDFWLRIESYAMTCDAGYVVVADEAMCAIEKCVEFVSCGISFDMDKHPSLKERIYDVWVRNEPDCLVPSGLEYAKSDTTPYGMFVKHDVKLSYVDQGG